MRTRTGHLALCGVLTCSLLWLGQPATAQELTPTPSTTLAPGQSVEVPETSTPSDQPTTESAAPAASQTAGPESPVPAPSADPTASETSADPSPSDEPTTEPTEEPEPTPPTPIEAYAAAHPEIGPALGPETSSGDVARRAYQRGTVVWSASTGAHLLMGAIGETWQTNQQLGLPLTDEWPSSGGGAAQTFQNGVIHWRSDLGAHVVKGAIRSRWESLGGTRSLVGFPTSSEISVGGGAVYQTFQHGAIYWSPSTIRVVHGAIGTAWKANGAALGWLGAPTSDEYAIDGGVQRDFTNGSIVWSTRTGAHVLTGAVRSKWWSLGGAARLGLPTTDEVRIRNGGVYQSFERGTTIYWTSWTGAHESTGAIRGYYAANNWENGRFGYPTTDEICNKAGCYQHFEGGAITWGPTTGSHDLYRLDGRCTWGRALCADKTTNKLYWVINGQIQATFDARFGAPGWETAEGQMRIFRKVADEISYTFGGAPMPYAQYFTTSGMAIHYSPGFEADGFPSWGSHGCINLNNLSQAQWLFNQTVIGDRIVVYWS